jgi:hypothetical protein
MYRIPAPYPSPPILSNSTMIIVCIYCDWNITLYLVMVLNTIINNISAIWWRSFVMAKKLESPDENTDLSQVTDKLHHIKLYREHLAWAWFELWKLVDIDTESHTYRLFDSIIFNTFFSIKWWKLSLFSWNLADMMFMLKNNENLEWLKVFHFPHSVATKRATLQLF